jgi:hypothetical protein
MLILSFATQANAELLKFQKDPGQWVMQRKDYAATAYSELSQITAEHVKHLKAAWTSWLGCSATMKAPPWSSAPQGDNKRLLTVDKDLTPESRGLDAIAGGFE